MNPRVRRVLGFAAWTAAGAVIALALATAGFRVLVPLAPQYRADLEAWAGRVLGAPVDIAALDLRWRGLRPELLFQDVRYVSADASRAFAAAEVRVGLSLAALVRGRIAPAHIVLSQPDLTVVLDRFADRVPGSGWRNAFAERAHRGTIEVDDGRLTLVADAGRRRYSFTTVDARVRSDGSEHRVDLAMHTSAAGTVSLDLRASGWPGDAGFEGVLTGSVAGADVRALQALAADPTITAGTVDADVALAFERGRLHDARVDATFDGLIWDGGEPRPAVASARWTRRAGGWDATFSPVADAPQPLTLTFTAADAPGAAAYWHLAGALARVDAVTPLARAAAPWLPPAATAWLAREPSGAVESLDLSLRRVDDAPPQWDLRASVKDLALAADPVSAIPGFAGASGTVTAETARGRAEIELRDATLFLPRTFRGSMPVASGEIVVDWHRDGDGWVVALPAAAVASPHARAKGDGRLVLRPGARPDLELDFTFDDVDLAANHPYLPVSVMPETVVAWLDAAVVGGRGERGVFRYSGPTGGAALASGEATLDIGFHASGIELAFADGWPSLEGGAAFVEFDGHGFRATLTDGALAGAPIEATVALVDYSAPELAIDGGASGDLASLLDAFRATPVGDAAWLADARADGTASLALALSIPLRAGAQTDVAGQLELADVALTLTGFRYPITGLDGVLEIDEDGVAADAIAGELFGQPVEVTAATLRDADGVATGVRIGFDGTLDAAALETLAERELPPVAGAAAWHGELTTHYDGGDPTLALRSDLKGMAIDLPEPLGKSAGEARPLALRVELEADTRGFTASGDDGFEAAGEFERADGGWALARARVLFGGGPSLAMPEHGIAVGGRLARWRHGADDGEPVRALGADASSLVSLDLEVGELELYGRALGTVRVDGERAPGGWFWVLHGERLSGSVDLPDVPTNDRPIRIELEHALLPEGGAAVDDVARQVAATAVPPIAFYAGRLTVGDRDFGEVSGLLRRIENGVALEGFTATRAEARLVAGGTWHTVDGYHRTTVRGSLDSTDVRATLAALGYAASVEAAAGHVEADLHWMDAIVGDPLPTLGGEVTVRIENGVLLDVEAGAGRVFGLLSLSALPRRLALDFSDVFRRGLAFDKITGRFTITDGDAYSDDLELVGPAVRIAVQGRTGLATRDYDQRAEVTASLASSLTLAGAIAGGPGVGAALLIASELFKGQLDDIARVRYRVSGAWDAPRIERVEPAR